MSNESEIEQRRLQKIKADEILLSKICNNITRLEMLDALINDFKKMFPESTRADRSMLRRKLGMLNNEEIKLLSSQISK